VVALFGLGGRAEVGLDGLVAREGLVGFLIGDDSGDDDVVALLPVGGGGDLVFGGELQGVEDAEDLVKVAAGGHRITELQLYLLVRADDEDGADGGVGGRGAAFAGAGLVGGEHVVELGDLEIDVAGGADYLPERNKRALKGHFCCNAVGVVSAFPSTDRSFPPKPECRR